MTVFKNKWFQGFIAGLIGVLASIFLLNYYLIAAQISFSSLTSEELNPIMLESLKVFVLTFFTWVAGKSCAKQMGINTSFKLDKNNLKVSVLVGLLWTIITFLSDKFIFEPHMGQMYLDENIFMKLYLILNGGAVEEIWFRLGWITVLAFAIYYGVFKQNDEKKKLSLIISMVFVLISIFLINLMNIRAVYYLDAILILKSLMLYMFQPLLFSVIYIKRGLVYSIVSHVTMLVLLYFIVIPIFF